MTSVINIRGLDPATIKALDRCAERSGMSRNAYLVRLLDSYTAVTEAQKYIARYERLTKETIAAINRNTAAMEQLLKEM